jgi:AbrB family looped-hinge helix DNA binding protein
MASMLVSVDRAGRVVIPKELRERLGLEPDAQLELDAEGDSLRLTPVRRAGRRVVDDDGWLVLEPADGVTITDTDVLRWRDADQR